VLVIVSIFISVGQRNVLGNEANEPTTNNLFSASGNKANFLHKSDKDMSSGTLFFKMIEAIVIVVVLGAAAIYISKKFVPRITNLSGKRIEVCESVYLGQRKTVHLIKIGNMKFLIGSTNENITMLADVTNSESETDLLSQKTNTK